MELRKGQASNKYVGSGVTRQAAMSVTPTSTAQTVFVNGKYMTGNITVNGYGTAYKLEHIGTIDKGSVALGEVLFDIPEAYKNNIILLRSVSCNISVSSGGSNNCYDSMIFEPATSTQTVQSVYNMGAVFHVARNLLSQLKVQTSATNLKSINKFYAYVYALKQI